MDIKKILFKYGDKAIFGIFVLLLIWSALRLVSSQPPDVGIISEDRTVIPVDPEIIVASNSRALFEKIINPLKADAGNDIATDPEKLEPGDGEIKCSQCGRILPEATEICPQCGYRFSGKQPELKDKDRDDMLDKWEEQIINHNPDDDIKTIEDVLPGDDYDGDGYTNKEEHDANSDPTDPVSVPQLFVIYEIGQDPVDILFKGYIVHEGGDVNNPDPAYWTIQLNWGKDTETVFIRYGGYFHNYKIAPLEKKVERVFKPAINDWIETDVWSLTIQKRGRKPIIVKEKTEAREQEPYARLKVLRGADKGKTTAKLYDGDSFMVNGEEFTVQSVTETEVVVLDKNKNFITMTKN